MQCSTRSILSGVAALFILIITFISLSHRTHPLALGIAFARSSTQEVLGRSDNIHDVYNSTLGFQKIYVISLPSRVDQRDAMSLAAHLSGLDIEYVDGVTDVDRRTLPPGAQESPISDGRLGAWRAHMNVIRRIVEQNVTSALVLEGDVDWDIRLKRQMEDFAKASRLLVQPLKGTGLSPQYLGRAHGSPKKGRKSANLDINEDLAKVEVPTSSPYGDIDRWDLLWLGHCGTLFPRPNKSKIPTTRVPIHGDETVPEPQHIEIQFGDRELQNQYPAHTRVVSRAFSNICSLGYGLSLPGARRILFELAMRKLNAPMDIMLGAVCDGRGDRPVGRTCLTVQPQLFQHHRPVGNKSTFSDIDHTSHGDGYNEVAFTRNVRWSTRLNFERLLDGRTDYVDLFKDGEEADTELGFG